MSTCTYTSEEWDERRSLIEQLYLEQRLTMRQVCSKLRDTGFLVNTRMVKGRVVRWGLHKKLHLPEMRTALEMLGPDRSQWPAQEPKFRIRQRVFTLQQILRSYGRRGIHDPLEWIQQNSNGVSEHSSHVELLTPSTGVGSETGPDEIELTPNGSDDAIPSSCSPAVGLNDLAQGNSMDMSSYYTGWYHLTLGGFSEQLHDPETHFQTATAIHQIQSYCLMYMASAYAPAHAEPMVHHLTCHARFLDHMDTAMALFVKGQTQTAFASFRLGFTMLKELIMDIHPMAVAIYLLLLCKLAVNKFGDVALILLRHTFELSSTSTRTPSNFLAILHAILRSGQFLEISLLCLRAASDVLEVDNPGHWKTLYVKERHCDALYYAQVHGEGAARRAQLLRLQEFKYGACARNVLWTSLNVADDHLIQGQLLEAEKRFSNVLMQSEQHSGYHRAKSRAVAMEGLAKVSYVRARKQLQLRPCGISESQNCDAVSKQLARASKLVDEAIDLAQVWFVGNSRRIERPVTLRNDIRAVVIQMMASRSDDCCELVATCPGINIAQYHAPDLDKDSIPACSQTENTSVSDESGRRSCSGPSV